MKAASFGTLIMGPGGQWQCQECRAVLGFRFMIEMHRAGCPMKAVKK